MRRRPGRATIRTRIIALTLIPVAALIGLWAFALVSMTGDLRALIQLESVYEQYGTPMDTAIGQIQTERRLSASYLGSDNIPAALEDLITQQHFTDEAVRSMRSAAEDPAREDDLTGEQREALDRMLAAAGKLPELRKEVIGRKLPWEKAVERYSAVIEPTFQAQSALTALQAGQLARESQIVIELVRVREYVSREDALVAGGRAAGRFTEAQYQVLTATIEDRRVFQRTYVPDLPDDSRTLFEDFERGAEYKALTAGEDTLLAAGHDDAGKALAKVPWRTTMDKAIKRYMLLCSDAAGNSADRGRDYAMGELVRAGIAGGLGLLAVGLSIWFSVRTGRRISRRLVTLRDSADVLATRQLPDVMRRLSAGEKVDAATEAPPLALGQDVAKQDEIRQVGRALNTARRAAIEAAVEQANLRQGVFAVFLNIARRNQALVHRQLKLVDTLERRTNDPDALQDLFRIDHLTTRMRRHAEGLIILSGAAPGRMWRRPVPVVNVVASAVGEIEDYTRVVVPPMPKVGIAGEAVADLVHLVAELLENATVFSPPGTQVTMRMGVAGLGYALEIDDRGLGMDVDQLDEANATLARAGEFDPRQTERLGLFVVGRLARRHGIEVTLCRSPYGGTTAVVFLPASMLADVAAPAAPAAPAENTAHEAGRDLESQPRTREREQVAERALPVRRREAPALTSGEGAGQTGEAEDPESVPQLPTRVRQASLVPQLREEGSAPRKRGTEPDGSDVSAEQMGAIFGAFQRGLDRGRRTPPPEPHDHDEGSEHGTGHGTGHGTAHGGEDGSGP